MFHVCVADATLDVTSLLQVKSQEQEEDTATENFETARNNLYNKYLNDQWVKEKNVRYSPQLNTQMKLPLSESGESVDVYAKGTVPDLYGDHTIFQKHMGFNSDLGPGRFWKGITAILEDPLEDLSDMKNEIQLWRNKFDDKMANLLTKDGEQLKKKHITKRYHEELNRLMSLFDDDDFQRALTAAHNEYKSSVNQRILDQKAKEQKMVDDLMKKTVGSILGHQIAIKFTNMHTGNIHDKIHQVIAEMRLIAIEMGEVVEENRRIVNDMHKFLNERKMIKQTMTISGDNGGNWETKTRDMSFEAPSIIESFGQFAAGLPASSGKFPTQETDEDTPLDFFGELKKQQAEHDKLEYQKVWEDISVFVARFDKKCGIDEVNLSHMEDNFVKVEQELDSEFSDDESSLHS